MNAYDACVEHEDVQPDDVVCLDTEVQVQEDDPMQYKFVRFHFHKIYMAIYHQSIGGLWRDWSSRRWITMGRGRA